MLPILHLCAEKKTSTMQELIKKAADILHLSEQERKILQPTGTATVVASRAGWAKTYLKKAGLVIQPARGMVSITPAGKKLLEANPKQITKWDLAHYPSFREFTEAGSSTNPSEGAKEEKITDTAEITPDEQITQALTAIHNELKDQLIENILQQSPEFFERLIINLILAMGYGSSQEDAGQHIGGKGDGGIDGVIKQDELGIEHIYLQAKRYSAENKITAEQVRGFLGALQLKHAKKGLFITTSSFTTDARETIKNVPHIVLIDGQQLSTLMIKYNIGVRIIQTVEVKALDQMYFNPDAAITE
nr:restriction endonuclease [Entomobacter blattae]